MKFSTAAVAATTLFASSALAKNVACVVDKQQVAVVDLETGSCPFTVPASLPVHFTFVSTEEYNIEWYYTLVNSQKFKTDIKNEGRIIEVPAKLLYGTKGAPLYQVHLEKEPASNSTAAIRKRLMKDTTIAKRDAADDFLASIEDTDGVAVEGSDNTFEVVDVSESSSASDVSEPTLTSTASGVDVESSTEASGASSTESSTEASGASSAESGSVTKSVESTVTEKDTVTMTITSCSNDICKGTTVPGTLGPVTTTVHGETTIFTTYCPVSSYESVESTKTITITSCSNNACHETTVAATPSVTETVVGGTVTEYITYCPITEGTETGATTQGTATEKSTATITVTSCSNDICKATTVPATLGPVTTTAHGGETTVYTTYCPVSSVETVESSKTITAVVCSSDKCHQTTVVATPSTTSGTIAGTASEVTEYVTYCPVTTPSGETVATEVITSEGSVYVPKTVAVTSEGSTYETTSYITVSKVTEGTTKAAESTTGTAPTVVQSSVTGSASPSATAAISTFAGSAASTGASFLALALIPLAYFF